jgi:hypothetical protein
MTLEDAKRATALGEKRRTLIENANAILRAHNVFFGAGGLFLGKAERLSSDVFRDEFNALVTRELEAQVGKIDEELRTIA